ncbi:MAG: alpha-galactosidase, partial [Paramuribaculum sp.]|nr:alpha-galactosidase [Paramuribaculum sp.]
MKVLISAALSVAAALSAGAQDVDRTIIRVATDNTDLIFEVGSNKRLYQTYLGPRLLHDEDALSLSWNQHSGSDGSVSTRGWEAYSTSGNEDFFEPALGITHADGNMTTYLY